MAEESIETGISATTIQKWGGVASFVMAVAYIVPSLIYLTGNLRDAGGPFVYSLADFLYGPVWAASLVVAVYALRERVGERAPRLMTLALLISLLAAAAFMTVASIRAANRHYHLSHPELHLESATIVLTVWTTLVAGLIGAAFHFLGWAYVLIGVAVWNSGRLPRILCGLYVLGGGVALLVYVLPGLEGNAIVLGAVVSIWQGILLWRVEPEAVQSPAHTG